MEYSLPVPTLRYDNYLPVHSSLYGSLPQEIRTRTVNAIISAIVRYHWNLIIEIHDIISMRLAYHVVLRQYYMNAISYGLNRPSYVSNRVQDTTYTGIPWIIQDGKDEGSIHTDSDIRSDRICTSEKPMKCSISPFPFLLLIIISAFYMLLPLPKEN